MKKKERVFLYSPFQKLLREKLSKKYENYFLPSLHEIRSIQIRLCMKKKERLLLYSVSEIIKGKICPRNTKVIFYPLYMKSIREKRIVFFL